MLRRCLAVFTALALAALLLPFSGGQDAPPDRYAGRVAKASEEWKKTVKRMRLPKGCAVELWAAEPHVANPVAFVFDEKGRCFVAETFRLHAGVTDNRNHMYWLDDDLAARTVADRVAMFRKHHGKKFAQTYEKDEDRVRLVEDVNGDGKADRATVFAGGFKAAADGIGSGVLARHGKVWFTNIPSLWLLQDSNGDGHADIKKALSTGYGVHVAFLGHDLHGLKMGPDGLLYFSVGDRGLHVETAGKTLDVPDTGSVLRCHPDGSGLEIVATGLRNPQELAFDEFGNLFTGDNNADGGDSARWVHLVEGGDSGWRIGYQYLPRLGPWNAEKLWHTAPANTGRYLLPPLAHIGNGPSGLTYHPGVSLLPRKYQRHFFLSDFRGGGGGSGVHAVALKPKGASFEVTTREPFVWSVLATDCDFGPDGGFYISDWVEGWGLPNKGRIWKILDPSRKGDPAVAQVKQLLAEGFAKRGAAELAKLLNHADMRVRQEAQFALADRGDADTLTGVAKTGSGLARLHAIWGLGQLGRKRPDVLRPVRDLAQDRDAEVRAQALKVLGAAHDADAVNVVIAGLKAAEPRVRFFAAQAAGQIGAAQAIPAVARMLRDNADQDAYLRHAGVMALAGISAKHADALKQAAEDASPSVRLAVLLALRRQRSPEVARYLKDADATLVLEAARAIYDVPIPEALPKLAALAAPGALPTLPPSVQAPVLQRALAALNRAGTPESAQELAAFAARAGAPAAAREQALQLLLAWEKPAGRDPVVGLWRPLPPRKGETVARALRPVLGGIMAGPDKVRAAGAKLAARHGIKEVGPVLRDLVLDKARPTALRIEALAALSLLKDARLDEAARTAVKDADARLRHQARRVLLRKAKPDDAVRELTKVLAEGAIAERQGALGLLATLKVPAADALLAAQLDRLLANQTPPELRLDVLEAAQKRGTPALRDKLKRYERALSKSDPLAVYRVAQTGGDAEAGRRLFFEKTEVSCLRCHKINGNGGEVGPDLTGIGKKYQRDYLLESIVEPNRQIAKGYETLVLTLTNGQLKTGVLRSEDAKVVRLMTPEGQSLVVPKAQIDDRQRGPSAMPGDLVQKLSRTELRDLIEFLATLR